MTTSRKFGVEIEYHGVSRYDLKFALEREGIACEVERYNHTTRSHWKVTTDISVRGSEHTGELVSPILKGEDGMAQLEKVCEVMNRLGCQVNRSCGLHVHIDSRDLEAQQIKSVAKRYQKYQSSINTLMPRSRHNGMYCQTIQDQYIARMERATSKHGVAMAWGKFHVVNLNNVSGRGSIEFRQHSGTTDFRKISGWINFLQQFVQKSIELSDSPRRTTMAGRAFAHARTLLEDSGYEVKHRRYRDDWAIVKDGEVQCIINGEELRAVYDADTSAARRTAMVNNQRFGILVQVKGLHLSSPEAATDQGWTDGLSDSTKQYIQSRADELNNS